MKNSHADLPGGPLGPHADDLVVVSGQCKAFILCFIYYAIEFAPDGSAWIEKEECLAAVSEIVKQEHGLDIQPDHILAYHKKAKVNAKEKWDHVAVARFMADQVQDEETVKRITSFELHPAVVAKLSFNGKDVLENVMLLANYPHRPNNVRTDWKSLSETIQIGAISTLSILCCWEKL